MSAACEMNDRSVSSQTFCKHQEWNGASNREHEFASTQTTPTELTSCTARVPATRAAALPCRKVGPFCATGHNVAQLQGQTSTARSAHDIQARDVEAVSDGVSDGDVVVAEQRARTAWELERVEAQPRASCTKRCQRRQKDRAEKVDAWNQQNKRCPSSAEQRASIKPAFVNPAMNNARTHQSSQRSSIQQ